MPRTRPPYPLGFRQEAVRLARESGKPGTQIAQDLGVSYESLRHWVKQADLDAGRRTDGLGQRNGRNCAGSAVRIASCAWNARS